MLAPSTSISRPIAGVSQFPSNHGDVVLMYKETTSGVMSIECRMKVNVHGRYGTPYTV